MSHTEILADDIMSVEERSNILESVLSSLLKTLLKEGEWAEIDLKEVAEDIDAIIEYGSDGMVKVSWSRIR